MYVEQEKNSMGQDVIMVTDTTAVKYQPHYPLVTISQMEEGGKDTEFESVYISKNTIIHLAAHFLAEGANHDLSYGEICDVIQILERQRMKAYL
jgi:hypothetical protein